jgi:hypothetical protein
MLLDLFSVPTTLTNWLILIIALVILWIIVSIPVYFAGKMVTAGKAHFGQAMGATLGGGIIYFIVIFAFGFFLTPIVGPVAIILGLIVALIAWLAVYRASFDTNWIRAVGIVVVAWIVLLILDFIFLAIIGVEFPRFYPW